MFMTRCSSLSLELVYQPYLALGYAFAKKNCDDGGVDDDAIFARTGSLIPRKGTNPKDIFHRLLSMTRTSLEDYCPFLEKQSCRNAKIKKKVSQKNINCVRKWSSLVSRSELNFHQPNSL